jgi:hypothetical protein
VRDGLLVDLDPHHRFGDAGEDRSAETFAAGEVEDPAAADELCRP